MKRYLLAIEKTGTGYSAYLPDLPGCVSTGSTQDEVEKNMSEAVALHVDGLRESGELIPEPNSYPFYVQLQK